MPSITETISEQDIARLYYALDNFDQDLIPILSRLERVAVAGEVLAKAVESMDETWCDGKHHENINGCCPQDWKDQRDRHLVAYRSAIEEKNV